MSDDHCEWMFVPHWRHIIEAESLRKSRFVGFHLGRLPRDRGGSPIQHQILRGDYASELCALELNGEVDSGPVLMRRPFDLSEGSLKDILEQASECSARMMRDVVLHRPEGVKQVGSGTLNRRRSPETSKLPEFSDARAIYDFIRMLDCPGYPSASVDHGEWQLKLTSAKLIPDGVSAEVIFTRVPHG